MATLYEIDKDIEAIIDRMFEEVDEETGEVKAENVSKLKELQEAREQKLDNLGAFIKNLTSDVDAMKAEKDILDKRIKTKQKKIEWLKSYVASDLIANNQAKFESSRVVFSFRKSTSVSIPDETKIPKKYFKKVTTEKLDREGIGKLLKEGHTIRGAELIEKQNLQIK